MLLALSLVVFAWVASLTPLRRLVSSESVVAFAIVVAVLVSIYRSGRLV